MNLAIKHNYGHNGREQSCAARDERLPMINKLPEVGRNNIRRRVGVHVVRCIA